MIEFKFDKKELENLTRKLCQFCSQDRQSVTKEFFKRTSRECESVMKKDILSGQVLKVRTGRLRSSIGYQVIDQSDGLVAYIGSGVRQGARVKYANIHETGGTILPKKSKYLSIPLSSVMTKSRSQLRGHAFSPRDFDKTFVYKSKKNNLLIARKTSGGRIENLFVLKKSVTIPARKYMTKTVAIVRNRLDNILDTVIKERNK